MKLENMDSTTVEVASPFLDAARTSKADSLAILQLSRDNFLPVYLKEPAGEHDGYAEGAVVNTRYGSFPHSTLLGVPWGSQIRASNVDTGSRGRQKRKREVNHDEHGQQANAEGTGVKDAKTASSGFLYILPPTPELWTMSLPHRTQVVYTPDYSYILQRIRARPGSRLIEAGSGSGSFTHASVRAVYDGYPKAGQKRGKVFSFEHDRPRYEKMKNEIADHGLEGVVQLTHRDVYKDGFSVDGQSPEADAVFLDLPAPWEALPHLSRRSSDVKEPTGCLSPLNANRSVYLCTFSPCIEQVTRTISVLRRLGWVNIEMTEIAHRRFHVTRERVGLHLASDKGANVTAYDVDEALTRLADVEERQKERAAQFRKTGNGSSTPMDVDGGAKEQEQDTPASVGVSKAWKEGRLVTKGEPEIKSHTSYLVFAILPREWTEEDEAAALAKWPIGREDGVIGKADKASRRQENREKFQRPSKRSRKKMAQKEECQEVPVGSDVPVEDSKEL